MEYKDMNQKIQHYFELLDKDQVEAQDFYFKELFSGIVKSFIEKSQNKIQKKYDTIVSIIGYSPEPAILIHKLIQPKYHIFITDYECTNSIDTIQKVLNLKHDQYQVIYLEDKVSTSEIYQSVKSIIFKHLEKELLIDITGGKKSMSANACLSGFLFKKDIAYVNGDYKPKYRKPIPTSEYIEILDNPYEDSGDIELQKAIQLFNENQFEAVMKQMDKEKVVVTENSRQELLYNLSKIYNFWDQFKFQDAANALNDLINPKIKSKQLNKCDFFEHLKMNYRVLVRLISSEENSIDWVMNFYLSAQRLGNCGRYDIGILLLYRTLEAISQSLLLEYGVNTDNEMTIEMYERLGFNLEMYNQICSEVFNKKNKPYQMVSNIKNKIALLDGFILLAMKNNAIVKDLNFKELNAKSELRNKSIFAHGRIPVNEKDFKILSDYVYKLLEKYYEYKKKQSNIEEYIKDYVFPELTLDKLQSLKNKYI